MKSAPSWRTIEQMERGRWMRHAELHAADSPLCARVLDAGRVTPTDAAQMGAEAVERGWTIERAGASAGRKRRT